MSLQAHVDHDVAVVLVVVRDVEHQDGAADRLAGPHAGARRHLDRLVEVGVGGGTVDAVALRQRLLERFNQRGLRRHLFLVGGRRRLLASGLRAEERVRVDDVADELRERADLRRRLEPYSSAGMLSAASARSRRIVACIVLALLASDGERAS